MSQSGSHFTQIPSGLSIEALVHGYGIGVLPMCGLINRDLGSRPRLAGNRAYGIALSRGASGFETLHAYPRCL